MSGQALTSDLSIQGLRNSPYYFVNHSIYQSRIRFLPWLDDPDCIEKIIMEYFSLDIDAPLKEIEKQTLSSGRAIADLTKLMELIQLNGRPRRHVRDTIAAAVIAMERINKQANITPKYFSVGSIGIALDFKQPMGSGGNYIKAQNRSLLLRDLQEFQDAIKAVLDKDQTSDNINILRDFLLPATIVFDEVGQLSNQLESSLRLAGAKSIAISSSGGEQFHIHVGGTMSEEEFTKTLNDVVVGETPPIQYEQLHSGVINEDSGSVVQMGDWTVAGFKFKHQISDS